MAAQSAWARAIRASSMYLVTRGIMTALMIPMIVMTTCISMSVTPACLDRLLIIVSRAFHLTTEIQSSEGADCLRFRRRSSVEAHRDPVDLASAGGPPHHRRGHGRARALVGRDQPEGVS